MGVQKAIGTAPPGSDRAGTPLLLASLMVWMSSTWLIFVLSHGPTAFAALCAILGGIASAGLGIMRTRPKGAASSSVGFQILTNLAASAIWALIICDLLQNGDTDPQWTVFFSGALMYAITREAVTGVFAFLIHGRERRAKEAYVARQRERVFGMLAAQPEAGRGAKVIFLPVDRNG